MKPSTKGILTGALLTMLTLRSRGAESPGQLDTSADAPGQTEISNRLSATLQSHMEEMARLESNRMAALGIKPPEWPLIGVQERMLKGTIDETNVVYGKITNDCRLALRLGKMGAAAGQPITMFVSFQNLGAKPVLYPGRIGSRMACCVFKVLDDSGQSVSQSPILDWPGSRDLPDALPPGSEVCYEFRLDRLFNLVAGKTYSVYVEKEIVGPTVSAGPAVLQVR